MPIPVPAPTPSSEVIPGIVPAGFQLGRFTVVLDDLMLGVVDDYGTHLHVANLKGWWEGPGSTGSVDQRAADHGGWVLPAYYTPRVLQLDLRINGANWDHVGAALDRVQARLSLAELRPFTVLEESRGLQAQARQHGDPQTSRQGAAASLSLSLIAPDPRRYDIDETKASTRLPSSSGGLQTGFNLPFNTAAHTDSGVLQVTNGGNMPTSPVLTVTGPCPPFTLTHRGSSASITYPYTVDAGRTVVIDTDARTVLLDGTAPRFVTGTWFEYAPGVNEVVFSAASYDPGALLTSVHRNAWK